MPSNKPERKEKELIGEEEMSPVKCRHPKNDSTQASKKGPKPRQRVTTTEDKFYSFQYLLINSNLEIKEMPYP
jgi:hypothetical protein